MQTLAETFREHIAAGFAGLYIRSDEHDDAEAELAQACRSADWTLARWDIDRGLQIGDHADPNAQDPLAALKTLPTLANESGRPGILVLRNLHHFMKSPEIMQAIDTQIAEGKTRATHLVILAPVAEIPRELERQFTFIDHALPTREQLADIAARTGTEPGECPEGDALSVLMDASAGLTRMEAENAYSLSIVRHGSIKPETVWELKTGALKKTGLLSLHRGAETFESIRGLANVKDFGRRTLRPDRPASINPKGMLLLGVPGTGKSAFAKALGNETGRPTLTLDVGALMGSLVGQTEENTRRALAIADAMAPCVLFIDEIEKGLAGSAGSGQTDSGVSARMLGTLLTWLNDHTSDVFVIATSNNLAGLPAELTRAGRFDALFFIDFPGQEQREAIWLLYCNRYGLDAHQARPDDAGWTGAEIEACCRASAMLGIPTADAARFVVPIHHTAGERMERLRQWAAGRCLDAEAPGIYKPAPVGQQGSTTATKAPAKARRIQRGNDPSSN